MLNEKKELKNNELNNKELPEEVTELSMEDAAILMIMPILSKRGLQI